MSRVSLPIVALSAAALLGCGNGIQEVAVTPAPTTLQAVAESTTVLVSYAALATDTAMVKVRVATIARTVGDARSLVLTARDLASRASTHASAAIRQGDWIENVVAADSAERESAEFERYWRIGRSKLATAQQLSGAAIAVADSALSCTDAACATLRARQMQGHVEAAAGVAREAESVVRVAMVHVH